MHETIKKLLQGDTEIIALYQRAAKRWKEILAQPRSREVDELASLISTEQTQFELDCGMNRSVAQEIMVVVGFAQFYDIGAGFHGHKGDVHLVRLAIERSYCSLEVKYLARHMAEYYRLPSLPDRE